MIEAAALVRREVPGVEVRLYGTPSDPDYYEQCQARVRELGLEQTVVFAGTTTTPWDVYRSADVVAMASVSEAFPYAVIESMLAGDRHPRPARGAGSPAEARRRGARAGASAFHGGQVRRGIPGELSPARRR